jgi:phosphomannomutase
MQRAAQPQPDMPSPSLLTARAFAPVILREYDIRGQVGINLDVNDAYTLGRAFGTYVVRKGGKRVCVGYDGRLSSPVFAQSLSRGLSECGLTVEQIGLGPSPMLYFAVKSTGADAGIMVTGSHNPADYNGFKMMLQKSSVFGEEIQAVGKIAAAQDFENGDGTVTAVDIMDRYVARLMQDYEGGRKLKIAWDAGNGSGGEALRQLIKQLPGDHILMYDDIDGTFPNHHPDPTVDKNLADLRACVVKNNCDLGIAFDGDADRIGAVDEQGNILRCDALLTIYARDVLSRHPGAAIIGDVKCSQVMFDEINRLGGRGIMWKTGHSLVKAKMTEEKSPLAGELSGHIFFADKYYGYDDALYCAVRLINALKNDDVTLSSLTAHLPKTFSTPEIRIDVDEDKKFGIVPQIVQSIKADLPAGWAISEIDGIRVTTPDGWWLVRPSNTQAALACRVEARSEAAMAGLLETVKKEVAKLGYALTLDH